jgi:dethiobiotin synthetase
MSSLPGLLIVGTDTGVGKTRVTAAIARVLISQGRRVGLLKPVATGAVASPNGPITEDGELLAAALGPSLPRERIVPLAFEEPLAPCVAARRQGRLLEHGEVMHIVAEAIAWWRSRAEILLVEGIGGLLCPLAERTTVADLAVALDYPLVIVARRGLGTLNHSLLTVEAARSRGLRIAGIILNEPTNGGSTIASVTNAEELSRRLGGVAILGEVGYLDDPTTMATALGSLDWTGRACAPRWSGSPAAGSR